MRRLLLTINLRLHRTLLLAINPTLNDRQLWTLLSTSQHDLSVLTLWTCSKSMPRLPDLKSANSILPLSNARPTVVSVECQATVVSATSYRQSGSEAPQWQTAIDKEYNAIIDRHIWDLVPLLPGRKPIGCQYVFAKKCNAHGSLACYKARLVARGDSQKEGIDYIETYAPTARSDTLNPPLYHCLSRLALRSTRCRGCFPLRRADRRQTPNSISPANSHPVCRLRQALYGLRQASNEWYKMLSGWMTSNGFTVSKGDPCLFFKPNVIYIVVHVDNLTVSAPDIDVINKFKVESTLPNGST